MIHREVITIHSTLSFALSNVSVSMRCRKQSVGITARRHNRIFQFDVGDSQRYLYSSSLRIIRSDLLHYQFQNLIIILIPLQLVDQWLGDILQCLVLELLVDCVHGVFDSDALWFPDCQCQTLREFQIDSPWSI